MCTRRNRLIHTTFNIHAFAYDVIKTSIRHTTGLLYFMFFLICFCFVCMPQIPTRGWRMLFLCCSHWAVFCILFCCIFPRWNCGNPLWDVSKAMSVNLRRVVGGVLGVHMHHCASRFIDHRGRSPYHSITHHSFHPHIDRLAVVDAKCRLLLLLGSAKAYIKLQVHRAR